MSDVVILLGAGASRESGAPLMANFLDKAEDLLSRNQAGIDTAHFEQVFDALKALKHIPATFHLDIDNLESVFSAFEMGHVVGRLGGLTPEQIEAARTGMIRVITRTLQETMQFSLTGVDEVPVGLHSTPSYREFAQSIDGILQSKTPLGPPTIISLNYDLGLELALFKHGIEYNYGLEPSIPEDVVKVLKLHGSLNWGKCAKCGCALVWNIGDFIGKYISPTVAYRRGESFGTLPIGDHISQLRHCDVAAKNEPLIVPPTWNKSENPPIREVWRHTAKELSEAKYLFLIGYSFPETDHYLRNLAAVGLSGSTRVRKVIVMNPDPNAFQVFAGLAGPVLRQRLSHERAAFSGVAGRIHTFVV